MQAAYQPQPFRASSVRKLQFRTQTRSLRAMNVSAVNDAHIALANSLADAAGKVAKQYFRTPVAVDIKSDASPVTIADREAEKVMRLMIESAAPDHAIFGEEHGLSIGLGGSAEWLWVLDPIDGTKSFITGKPLFGTLIALLHKGKPVLGIIDQPILSERWLGVDGRPSTLNGKHINTRKCSDISLAYLYATTPHMFSGATEEGFNRVRDKVRIPMYGCDCYAYGLLAAGLCDLVVEADLKPYDYMALVPIIQGAGGKITDWRGNALHWQVDSTDPSSWQRLPPGEVLAAGDPELHSRAQELIGWA